MKKILFAATLALSSLVLSGCVMPQPPTQAEMASANYGELPANYEALIQNFLYSNLKDPYTAQYRFLKPFKGYAQNGAWVQSKESIKYGWIIPFYLNAKNSYGAYIGEKKYFFIYSNGRLYDVTLYTGFNGIHPAPNQ
ncbi:hypothetical protein KKJ01_18770 [Xenorhabdus bovienii]|uniref:Lipoprotein n=2 Tax=Xenorhabdus TaxID=626 RepID=A0AAJ1N0V2_XENBV|nr:MULTISPECIES: hypothetical protein [Xenorhabdus]MDC9588351.1 hypothetical protein [Xenorhabdus yunnanensis]MDE1480204.1 hypothetical protein [Xenorhabdus bovienii]MDE9511895.1 hypothetical protein [Xenorhabdus bovienii]MDE9523537.1 hypothetical protein [Xenorhabdus bovienii]